MASSTFFKLATGAQFTLPGYPAKEDGTSVTYTKLDATRAQDEFGRIWSFSPALAIGAQGTAGQSSGGTGTGTGTGTGSGSGTGSGTGTKGQKGDTGATGPVGPAGAAADMTRTSSTSVLIATGSISFTFDTPSSNLGWAVGSPIQVASRANTANWMLGTVTAVTSTDVTLNVTSTSGSGTFSDWNLFVAGEVGPAGADGFSSSIFLYKADANDIVAPPASGYLIWNNATQTSATHHFVSTLTSDGFDISAIVAAAGSSVTKIVIQDQNSAANYQIWSVSGTPVLHTGYFDATVTLVSSGGTGTTGFPNNHQLFVAVYAPGPAGATGPAGPGVPTGGTANQVLEKIDGTDFNTQWVTPATGADVLQVQVFS